MDNKASDNKVSDNKASDNKASDNKASDNESLEKSFSEYCIRMKEFVAKYEFLSPENPGNMPLQATFSDNEYTLIRETHPAVCDNPLCQKMFDYQDYKELGYSAFFYPILPVYTNQSKGELCGLCMGL